MKGPVLARLREMLMLEFLQVYASVKTAEYDSSHLQEANSSIWCLFRVTEELFLVLKIIKCLSCLLD